MQSNTKENITCRDGARLISNRLPFQIRQVYAHKLDKDKHLMDFKTDIDASTLNRTNVRTCAITDASNDPRTDSRTAARTDA